MSARSKQLVVRLESGGVCVKECAVSELPPETRVGRAPDCFWRIPDTDKSASGHHAIIRRKGKRAVLADTDSRNGVYFKGSAIRERRLSNGDIIGIGDSKLVIELMSSDNGPKAEFHTLEQLGGADKGKTIPLDKPVTRVGSGRECEVRIADSLVSHVHAIFEVRSDGYCYVKDNSSRNGIKINGTRQNEEAALTGQMLKDGDIVSVAYVDFRFWDRNVQHVRANIAQKILVVFATLAIALGGYFGVQTLYPSAKTMRLKAERLAAAGHFADAAAMAKESAGARGAELDSDQRSELMRRLVLWEQTANGWHKIRAALSDASVDLWAVNADFAKLISSDDENWKWNTADALVEMSRAKATQAMLARYLSGIERLGRSDGDRESFAVLASDAEAILASSSDVQPYQAQIREFLADLAAEFRRVVDETGKVKDAMEGYDSIESTDDVLASVSRLAAESARRVEERKKAGRPVSPLTDRICRALTMPLSELQNSLRCLESNYLAVAETRFSDFVAELPVPDANSCMADPNLTTRRSDMINQNDLLRKAILQLKSFRLYLDSEKMLKADGKTPPAFEVLFDSNAIAKALDCDCFGTPPPGFSVKTATSAYDALFGVNVFYQYLSSIDGDFDSSVLEERFVPGAFRAAAAFKTIGQFLTFCDPNGRTPYAPVMKKVFAAGSANACLVQEVKSVKALIGRREEMLRTLDAAAARNARDRRGLLAAGLAFLLREGSLSSEDDTKTRNGIAEMFKAVRKKAGEVMQASEGKGPEARLAAETAVLKVGIPGDPLIRQPWADRTKGGTK